MGSAKQPGVGRGRYTRPHPPKVYVSFRVPAEVASYFRSFDNASDRMRRALVEFMERERGEHS